MTDLAFTPETRMLVDGELIHADSGKTFDNVNPATEEVLGQVADALGGRDAAGDHRRPACVRRDRLVDQPGVAQALPRAAARGDRGRGRAAARGVDRRGRLATRCHLHGPARWSARRRVALPGSSDRRVPSGSATWARHRCSASPRIGPSGRSRSGVVGAITPWNYPFEVTINKVAQILATGNTMVLKPAPDTPWNATRLGPADAGEDRHPAGVVNVVTSSDHLVGEELTLSPMVDMISFTGSTVTGKRIMEKGAPTLKRVFLELGGKSAMIVLDDADFPAVVPMALDRVHARRPGLRDADPPAAAAIALRRRCRADHGRHVPLPVRRPAGPSQHDGPADQREAARTGCSATSPPVNKKAPRWRSAVAVRHICPRVGSSSRPCSPRSTTR